MKVFTENIMEYGVHAQTGLGTRLAASFTPQNIYTGGN